MRRCHHQHYRKAIMKQHKIQIYNSNWKMFQLLVKVMKVLKCKGKRILFFYFFLIDLVWWECDCNFRRHYFFFYSHRYTCDIRLRHRTICVMRGWCWKSLLAQHSVYFTFISNDKYAFKERYNEIFIIKCLE